MTTANPNTESSPSIPKTSFSLSKESKIFKEEDSFFSRIHPVLWRLLKKKNLSSSEIADFLSWDLKTLPDLLSLKDLEKASKRLIMAMEAQEPIGIYGDYDVDGTTSCALFHHFFQMLNYPVSLFQPSRFVEGYGLHLSSIDQAKLQNIAVLITVDCGITNNEAADYAREQNVDLIITDHHKDAREEMPNAFAVINPNRRDEPSDSPLRFLAGVGVAFALALQIRKDLLAQGQQCPSLYPLLPFVAIGTICDLAHLNSMNLKLTRHGLKLIKENYYPGLSIFFTPEELKRNFAPSEKVSFSVGPLINSKGRLDHPEKALLLLTAKTDEMARENFFHLEMANRQRKIIQKEVFEKAQDQVVRALRSLQSTGRENPINIVYDPTWHEGVIGIVASKLVETFKVPAIVLTNAEERGVIKGSARSAGNLNIFDCLKKCEDLFHKFGGHKAAAGLSMPKDNYPKFCQRMDEMLLAIPQHERIQTKSYDLCIEPEELDAKLVRDLDYLEPFGMGNPRPLFRMENIRLETFQIMKDIHIKWFFSSQRNPQVKIQGVSFNYLGKWGCLHPEEIFEKQKKNKLAVHFNLGLNHFKGNEFIQLIIENIFCESP